jgi:hypothetical protein
MKGPHPFPWRSRLLGLLAGASLPACTDLGGPALRKPPEPGPAVRQRRARACSRQHALRTRLGWIGRAMGDEVTLQNARRFASCEEGVLSVRPRLRVRFSHPQN